MKEIILSPLDWDNGHRDKVQFLISRELDMNFSGSHIIYANESDENFVLKQTQDRGVLLHEWNGLKQLSHYSLPVQQGVGLSIDQNGILTLISREVKGFPIYQVEEGQRQLGESVRQLHQVVQVDTQQWNQSGKYDFTYYDRILNKWDQDSVPDLQRSGKIVGMIFGLSTQVVNHLKIVKPAFLHNDVHDGQGFIDDGRCILIDFERWGVSDPLEDIAYYLYHQIRNGKEDVNFRKFVDGYFSNQTLSESQRNTLAFYLLYFASRSAVFFYEHRPDYYPIGQTNLLKTVQYVDSEKLWKC